MFELELNGENPIVFKNQDIYPWDFLYLTF